MKNDYTYGCMNTISNNNLGTSNNNNSNSNSNYNYKIPSNARVITQIPLAYDGITIFVKRNSVVLNCFSRSGMTLSDLRWIYSNKDDNSIWSPTYSIHNVTHRTWSQLFGAYNNCPNEKISIYGPDSQSGTYSFFQETVLFGDNVADYYPSRYYNGSINGDAIINNVINDEYGIGYAGHGRYLKCSNDVVSIAISSMTNAGSGGASGYIIPNTKTIGNQSYPISRPIYINIENINFAANDAIYQFVKFIFTPHGQSLLTNITHYVPLMDNVISKALNQTVAYRGVLSSKYNYGDLGGSKYVRYYSSPDTTACTIYARGKSSSSGSSSSNNNMNNISVSLTGSSTVYPVANVWAYNFVEWMSSSAVYQSVDDECIFISITIEDGGSSIGAMDVCNADVLIADMSREWRKTEAIKKTNTGHYKNNTYSNASIFTCTSSFNNSNQCLNIMQIKLAIDGLTVFVKNDSDIAQCIKNLGGLTYKNLSDIFSSDAGTSYKDVLINCNVKSHISLAIPGDDSGTQSFFCQEILGIENPDDCSAENSFNGYSQFSTENDNDIINLVKSDYFDNVIAFVGFGHYLRASVGLYAIPVAKTAKDLFITPTQSSIDDGSYPLTRPLFMNTRNPKYNNINSRNDDNYDYDNDNDNDIDDGKGKLVMQYISDFIIFGMNTTIGQALTENVIGYLTLQDNQAIKEINNVLQMDIILDDWASTCPKICDDDGSDNGEDHDDDDESGSGSDSGCDNSNNSKNRTLSTTHYIYIAIGGASLIVLCVVVIVITRIIYVKRCKQNDDDDDDNDDNDGDDDRSTSKSKSKSKRHTRRSRSRRENNDTDDEKNGLKTHNHEDSIQSEGSIEYDRWVVSGPSVVTSPSTKITITRRITYESPY